MDDPQSPDRPAYPRRFPRIGGQFQTRISKARDQLERPLPELMSSEFPHVSEEEFQGNKDSNKGRSLIFFKSRAGRIFFASMLLQAKMTFVMRVYMEVCNILMRKLFLLATGLQ
jgi:hypothetical protein